MNQVQKYLHEKMSYGGFAVKRGNVILDLKAQGLNQGEIGIYMLGNEALSKEEIDNLLPESMFLEMFPQGE